MSAAAAPLPGSAGLRSRLRSLVRPRLLTRVALALGLVGLLPVGIASYGLVDLNVEALRWQVLRTHTVAAKTLASRVAAFLDARRSLAQGAAGNAALLVPRSSAAQELLAEDLKAWLDLGVVALGVVNDQGEEAVRVQIKDPELRPAIDAALRPGVPAAPSSELAVVARQPMLILRLRAPLPQGAGSLLLVCRGDALVHDLRPVELGDEADLLVASRDGQVVLGTSTLADFPPLMVTNALSGRLDGSARYAVGGRGSKGDVLGAFAAVPESDWVVLSRQPGRVAEALARGVRRQAMWAIAAALLLIFVLSSVAWASLVRPLRALVRGQRRLAGVDGVAGSGDEIADLQEAFAVLEQSLKERRRLDNVFLGRYQVIEYLGSGAMGTVFRGWDPKLQRAVALKTIKLGDTLPAESRRELLDTLLHEAVTVARLSHGNVVSIFDVQDAPEGAFIAMEFVQGVSLERLLWRRGRLTPAEVICLGAGIARGLAVAHANGIVHRDMKPGNVLLGLDGAIKVTDFGIADLFSAAAPPSDSIFGTPGYVPPESLEGRGYDRSGDLFALGVVLYQCLAAVTPFAGRNVAEILKATLFGGFRPLGRQVKDVPPALESLIHHLLDHDPAKRPADASAVAVELERMAAEGRLRWSLDLGPMDAAEGPLSALEEERRIAAQWIPTSRLAAPGAGGASVRP